MSYLSNWEKLIQLSRAYGFRAVCVLQPTAVLDPAFGPRITADGYGLEPARAAAWVQALTFVYKEASRQVEQLQDRYPEVTVLDFSRALSPSEEHFLGRRPRLRRDQPPARRQVYSPGQEHCSGLDD